MPQTRLFNPAGLQLFSFAALAVSYIALTISIYLAFPALLGVVTFIAAGIVLSGQLERLIPK